MYKKRSLFITFEGIEGSGKSYQSKKLYKNLKRKKLPIIITREPGGTRSAEKIRNLLLEDYFYHSTKEKFDKVTDTLLYLASRNDHVKNKIQPAILKKKIIICDRFIDSTSAYQIYGKMINKNLVNSVHRHILGNIKPDITFILRVNISKAMKRIKKRRYKNRYDNFSRKFYSKVQNAFNKIAKKNKKRCFIIDNSNDSIITEKIIFEKVLSRLK